MKEKPNRRPLTSIVIPQLLPDLLIQRTLAIRGESNSRLRQTNENETCPGTAKDWVLWPGQSNAGTSIKLQSQNPRLTASSKLVVNLFRQINLPNLEFTR